MLLAPPGGEVPGGEVPARGGRPMKAIMLFHPERENQRKRAVVIYFDTSH